MKIFNAKWTSYSAGPSPDNNKRTEIFLHGCKRAMSGNPCKHCFNPQLWDSSKNLRNEHWVNVGNKIIAHAPNKYVTFVGGEPLDQLDELSNLCHMLKQHGFHIIVFTNHKLRFLVKKNPSYALNQLLLNIDILIDGQYEENLRIYEEGFGDGLRDAVGSANQIIWDLQEYNTTTFQNIRGYATGDLAGIYVSKDNRLKYIFKERSAMPYICKYNLNHIYDMPKVG